jgi:Tfp pilus assembly protein PilN
MRSVNLIPEEFRPRVPGDGDPRVAWGVLGGLALLFLMVLVAISYSNKLKTIEDQTAAITSETQQHQVKTAAVQTTPDQIASDVKSRTLLVGGLAKTRFPWGEALYDLSRAIPEDTTLTTITVDSGISTSGGGTGTSTGASMGLSGCTSSWVGYSRFLTWLKTMPGVEKVSSNSSSIAGGAGSSGDNKRTENCGPAPLNFSLDVKYAPRTIDLLGLPKPDSSGATGSTGAAAGAVPAASATPTPAPAPAAGGAQ